MDTDLLTELNRLRKLFNDLHQRINTSGVERTCGLRSTLGPSCGYYKKSLKLFLDNDYDQLKELVTKVYQEFTEKDQL